MPWTNFPNLPASINKTFRAFPSNYADLPDVSFVIPNMIHDMHDGTIGQADSWLRSRLGGYATWARTHNSVLVLTWDEDDFGVRNQIPTVIVGVARPSRALPHPRRPLPDAADDRVAGRAARHPREQEAQPDHPGVDDVGLNSTGIDSSPQTKFDGRFGVGAPGASRRSGSRANSRSNITRELQAGELVAETEVLAEAEREVRVRVAGDVERERVGEHRPRRGSRTGRAASAGRPRAGGRRSASTSRVSVRAMSWIGLTQRSISSTARGSCAGSAVQRGELLGVLSSSASMPPLSTCRVVSSPPMRISSVSKIEVVVGEPVAVDLGVGRGCRRGRRCAAGPPALLDDRADVGLVLDEGAASPRS